MSLLAIISRGRAYAKRRKEYRGDDCFPRSVTANDAINTVEISQDLRTWESGPAAEVNGNELTYRSAAANTDVRDLFARLHFEQR